MSAGLGPGSTNRAGAQPRHDAAATDGAPFTRAFRYCWHADRLIHLARPVGINNMQTACGRWVWDRRKELPRGTTVTCPDCTAAPRPSAAPHSPQSAGVAAGDGTDGPEPSQELSATAEGWREELRHAPVMFWICLNPAHPNVTWEGPVATCSDCGLTSEMTELFAEAVRAEVAEEIEVTRLEWNDEEPEGPNGCCDADVHNCHRDAGERAFAEAIRTARGGQAVRSEA